MNPAVICSLRPKPEAEKQENLLHKERRCCTREEKQTDRVLIEKFSEAQWYYRHFQKKLDGFGEKVRYVLVVF